MQYQGSVQDGAKDQVQVSAQAAVRTQRQIEGKAIVPFTLKDVIAVTARLAQLLAQEVDLLNEMRVKDIEKVQDEKQRLTRSLVLMRRELDRRPDLLKSEDPEDMQVFKQVAEIFEHVLHENNRKLMLAKEINHRVVQAISDVVQEETMRAGYNKRGMNSRQLHATPSISLNQTI